MSDKKTIVISDHAIVRYLERVFGADMEVIKDQILPPENRSALIALGSNAEMMLDTVHGKYRLIVRDGVVVSVISDDKKTT